MKYFNPADDFWTTEGSSGENQDCRKGSAF